MPICNRLRSALRCAETVVLIVLKCFARLKQVILIKSKCILLKIILLTLSYNRLTILLTSEVANFGTSHAHELTSEITPCRWILLVCFNSETQQPSKLFTCVPCSPGVALANIPDARRDTDRQATGEIAILTSLFIGGAINVSLPCLAIAVCCSHIQEAIDEKGY